VLAENTRKDYIPRAVVTIIIIAELLDLNKVRLPYLFLG